MLESRSLVLMQLAGLDVNLELTSSEKIYIIEYKISFNHLLVL